MRKLLAILILSVAAIAQGSTRTVIISWTVSTSVGVTGYTISTASSAGGPFTQIGCTGTVPGSTCVAGSTSTTATYTDTQTVGNTVFYRLVAVAPACTPTTPPTTACGNSVPASASTTIPPQPQITTLVVVVQ